jgi:hypothetical protein
MVSTDKPFYEPGEQITGKVFIRSTRPIDASFVELEIKGAEKCSFSQFETESYQEDG